MNSVVQCNCAQHIYGVDHDLMWRYKFINFLFVHFYWRTIAIKFKQKTKLHFQRKIRDYIFTTVDNLVLERNTKQI